MLQRANPWVLSYITVGVAALSAAIIWVAQNHIIEKIDSYETMENQRKIHRIINKINKQFKQQKAMNTVSKKREQYIQTKTGKFATFIFAIFCFLPVLPDIIGTRILYKKIRFPHFILAVIIGKSITHMTFIFVGKSIIDIASARIGIK